MTGSDAERWLEVNRLGLEAFYRQTPPDSPQGSVVEREGLVAAVTPTVPERSVFNGVVYSDTKALREALDDLARIYEEAGVNAWTVWVPEHDRAAAELLEAAGHRLDAEPRAMGMELDGVPTPDLGEIDWTAKGDLAEMAMINDRAYGYPDGTFAAGMADPNGILHIYVAAWMASPLRPWSRSTWRTTPRSGVWQRSRRLAVRGSRPR